MGIPSTSLASVIALGLWMLGPRALQDLSGPGMVQPHSFAVGLQASHLQLSWLSALSCLLYVATIHHPWVLSSPLCLCLVTFVPTAYDPFATVEAMPPVASAATFSSLGHQLSPPMTNVTSTQGKTIREKSFHWT